MLFFTAWAAGASAQLRMTVVPWNGHSAAYSITFDDGHQTQLDHGIPILDKHGLVGSIYLNCFRLGSRIQGWKNAYASGHEIGNHSRDHQNPSDVGSNSAAIQSEVTEWRSSLESALELPILTFAYPFGSSGASAEYQGAVARAHLAARGT